MKNTFPIFKETYGLNTVLDPVRLTQQREKGNLDLAQAVNINIDGSGRISRRKGYTRRLEGNYHSLFGIGDSCLAVKNSTLVLIDKDYTETNIVEVNSDNPMSYVTVNDKTYFMNGVDKGYVLGRSYYPWEFLRYIGPITNKTLSDPPIGTLIEIFNGRIYVVKDSVVWYSERFSYGAFDLSRSYIQLPSYKVRMIRGVKDGIFLGTDKEVIFLEGNTPDEFSFRRVLDSGVIEKSDVKVEGEILGENDIQGEEFIIFITDKGICAGFSGGRLLNLTQRKVNLPKGFTGAGIVMNKKYICTIAP